MDELINLLIPEVDQQLKREIDKIGDNYSQLKYMLRYHMGWEENETNKVQGKRIRPLLLLLSVIGMGGNSKEGLSSASAVELIHNFSLIHDDIEDNSAYRRGRKTLWVKWGIPQALNSGDLMFTLAQNAILDNPNQLSAGVTIELLKLLQKTCIRLTQGQYLDLLFESKNIITIDDYLEMISGKTAALLSCSTEMGAIISGVSEDKRLSAKTYGFALGMAFQTVDDILGIWGNEDVIGKSVESDLVQKKKSLPVIYALQNSEELRKIWLEKDISQKNLTRSKQIMTEIGARDFAEKTARYYTEEAMDSVHKTFEDESVRKEFILLTKRLLSRDR